MTEKNELMTLNEAQEILGYARSTMYRLFKSGELRPIRIYPAKQKQPVYLYRRDVQRFIQHRMALAS